VAYLSVPIGIRSTGGTDWFIVSLIKIVWTICIGGGFRTKKLNELTPPA
jgi:hypothetical protein